MNIEEAFTVGVITKFEHVNKEIMELWKLPWI